MRLLLFYVTVEVRESLTPDGFTLSAFGSVNLRLRSGFGDDFLLMPGRSTVKLFDKWESQWFFLRASRTRLRHTGDLPRHSGAGGLKEVSHPGEPRSTDIWKVAKIKEVSVERSFRDLMEEMVMAGRFMMRSRPRLEIGIPRSFRPPQLAITRECHLSSLRAFARFSLPEVLNNFGSSLFQRRFPRRGRRCGPRS